VEFVNSSGIEGSFHGVPVFVKTIAYIINNIFKKLNFTNKNLQHFEIKLRKESSSISKKFGRLIFLSCEYKFVLEPPLCNNFVHINFLYFATLMLVCKIDRIWGFQKKLLRARQR